MATAICKNCGEKIHTTPWSYVPWSHGPGWEYNQPDCPSKTRAEPLEGASDER